MKPGFVAKVQRMQSMRALGATSKMTALERKWLKCRENLAIAEEPVNYSSAQHHHEHQDHQQPQIAEQQEPESVEAKDSTPETPPPSSGDSNTANSPKDDTESNPEDSANQPDKSSAPVPTSEEESQKETNPATEETPQPQEEETASVGVESGEEKTQADADGEAEEEEEEEGGMRKQRRVLLFEDRPTAREKVRQALVARSFLVDEAHDIDDAVKLYKRGGRFDALLLGLEAPLFLAIQFIESIPRSKIPIALLIAQPADKLEAVIRKALELGASCYVPHSEDGASVVFRIEELLRRFDVAEAENKRMMEYLNPDYFINHAKRKDLSKSLQRSSQKGTPALKPKMRCLDVDGESPKQEVRMKFNIAVKKGQALRLKKLLVKRGSRRTKLNIRRMQQLSEKAVQKSLSDSYLPLLRDYQQRFKYAVLPSLPAPELTAKRSGDLLQSQFREKVPKVISTLPQRFLRQGYELKESGDYEGAIRKFNRAISDPRYAAAYLSRGVTLHIVGNDDAAMKDFDRCIKLKEFESLAHCNKALIHYYKGEDNLALVQMNKAIMHDRRDFGFYQCRALLHRRNGRFDQAKADYAKSRELIASKKAELKRSRSNAEFSTSAKAMYEDTGVSFDLIDPAEANLQYALDHISPFTEMDRNKDGRIDLEEYKQATDYGVDVYSSIFQRPTVLQKICRKEPNKRSLKEIDFLVRTLNEIEIVRALPNRQVKVLCRDVKCAWVAAGDCIMRQGDLGNYFYLVLSGEFAVKWDRMNGNGVPVIVNTVLGGGCFGEGTMYNPHAKRYASVFAQADGTLFMVSRHSFFASRLNESMKSFANHTSEVLRQSKIFNSMTGSDFEKLVFVSKPNYHDRNTILVRQGDPGSKFCIIISGICKMIQFTDVGAQLIEKERKLAHRVSQFEMSFTFHHTVKDPEARARAARATARYEAMKADLCNVRNKLKTLRSKESKGNVAPRIQDSQYLYPSNFFGEVSILDPYNGREPCTVVTETFTKVIEITKEELQTYKQSPELIEVLRSRSFYLGGE